VQARTVAATFAAAGLAFAVAAPVAAASGGNDNKGDVWVDNVSQPAGPGHEMDPHLQCQDINLWGDKLADSSGTYMIDGWNPSGSGTGDFNRPGYNQDQAWPATKASPGTASWSYEQKRGGSQVISVIDVHKLVEHAKANGDAPVNKQGLHFKLQFSQDPQKHKTFWVDCGPATPAPSADCDGDQDNSPVVNGVCEGSAPAGGSQGSAPAGGSQGTANTPSGTQSGSGGVSGAEVGGSTASTGSGVEAASTSIPSLPHAGAQVSQTVTSKPDAGLAGLLALAGLAVSVGSGLVYRLLGR